MKACSAPSLGQVLTTALRSGRLKLPRAHLKILNLLAACRTPALGGHRYRCTECGREHFVANTCGNRHCPSCQGAQAFDWLERQRSALLPIPYFHVVFTLPHLLNPLIRQNRRGLFNLLFESAAQTLLTFGRNDLQAQLGLTAVLHTWGQTLMEHYLSRYTHRVAIGNQRLLSADAQSVTFGYKDYAEDSRRKTMRLSVGEFVRRFCLHLLPKRFVKIRHYGLLGNRGRQERIQRARQSLGVKEKEPPPEVSEQTGPQTDPPSGQAAPRRRCPHCGAGALVCLEERPRRLRWIKPVWICDSS